MSTSLRRRSRKRSTISQQPQCVSPMTATLVSSIEATTLNSGRSGAQTSAVMPPQQSESRYFLRTTGQFPIERSALSRP